MQSELSHFWHQNVNVLDPWNELTTRYLYKIYNYDNKIKQANLHSEIDSKETTGNSSSHTTAICLGLTERITCIKINNHMNVPFNFLRYELIQLHSQTIQQKSKISSHHTRGFTPTECLSVSNCLTNVAADEYIGLSTTVLVINVWSRGRSSCRSMSSAARLWHSVAAQEDAPGDISNVISVLMTSIEDQWYRKRSEETKHKAIVQYIMNTNNQSIYIMTTKISARTWKAYSVGWGWCGPTLDRQSAAVLRFPSLNLNDTSNSCNASAHLISLELWDEACVRKVNGLWSKYTVTLLRNNHLWYFLSAQIDAKASFSTVDQLRCVGLSLTLANATGRSSWSPTFCVSTQAAA